METAKRDDLDGRLAFSAAFAEVPDPRVVGRSKYDLVEMLVVSVCAMVCGIEDFVGIEECGKEQIVWLRRFLTLENGIPSHDTLGRLFGLLDRRAVEKSFRAWVGSVLPALAEGRVVAIDGKASRRSRKKGLQPLHLVTAFATEARLILGQEACAEKSNELTAIPILLESLMLMGVIGSIAPDAALLAYAVRAHWGVENQVHWCLDVAFKDDQMRAREKNAGSNLATLRRFVLNLFRLDKTPEEVRYLQSPHPRRVF